MKAKAAEIEEAVYGPKAPPTSSSPATTPTASESTAASQPGIFLPDDVIKKSIEKKVGTKVYRAGHNQADKVLKRSMWPQFTPY